MLVFVSLRRSLIILWILILMGIFLALLTTPEMRDPRWIRDQISAWGVLGLLIYTSILMMRGVFLLPSLPFIVAGTLVFPENHLSVYTFSMASILVSSFLIYQFAHILGLDSYFESHIESRKGRMIHAVVEKYGFWGVVLWSFLPFTPTDLICYIAGVTRMNIWKFLTGILIGEGIIVALIVWGIEGVEKLL